MGCDNSKTSSDLPRRAPTFRTTKTTVFEAEPNLNEAAKQDVSQFPFFKTRLQPIDWQTIERSDTPFEDPHFPAEA